MSSKVSKIAKRILASFDSKVLVGPKIRIRLDNYTNSWPLVVEELPTKPAKRRLRRAEVNVRLFRDDANRDVYLVQNIMRFSGLDKGMSYEQAVRSLKGYFQSLVDERDLDPKTSAELLQSVTERDVSWLDVEPVDYEPITVKGDGVTIYSKWDSFSIREEEEEKLSADYAYSGDPHYSYYGSSSPGAARKLFKFLKANPGYFRTWTAGQVEEWLRSNKIGIKYNQSYWH